MLAMARGWLVYQMTNSPFMLGAVTGAFSIPIIVLAFPGGAIADRFSKKKMMIVSEAIVAFLSLSLGLLILTNSIAVWHLMLASLISGTAFSFGQPAKQAIIPEIVPRDILMNAIALGSTGFNAMRILAPSLGGFLMAFLGIAPVYFIGTLLQITSVIFLMPIREKNNGQSKAGTSLSEDVMDGLKYIRKNRIVLTLFMVIMVATLFAQPFQFLLPIFARDILKAGEVGLGWMMAATGTGSVISTLAIASLVNFQRKAYLLLGLMGLLGLMLGIFAFSTSLIISLAFLLMLGLCATGFNTMSNTMLQTYSSTEMRGRVMGIMTISFGVAPLGAVPLGAVAEITGAPVSLAMGGALVFLVTLAIGLFYPGFRKLQ